MPFGRAKARSEELQEALSQAQQRATALEEENARLRERHEGADRRRREAAAARQEAEERANRLEDRIRQLEGDLERLQEDATDSSLPVRRRLLSGRRLDQALEFLGSMRGRLLTACVHDEVPPQVQEALGERAVLVKDAAPCLVLLDDTGLLALALRPPLVPDLPPTRLDRFLLEPEWFRPTGRFVFALVRSDLFAAGVYEGDEQVRFQGASPPVRRRHTKGGFSQGRYEQHRKDHVAEHLRRCGQVLRDLRQEGPLYLVGQRQAVQVLDAEVKADRTAASDATGTPPQGPGGRLGVLLEHGSAGIVSAGSAGVSSGLADLGPRRQHAVPPSPQAAGASWLPGEQPCR